MKNTPKARRHLVKKDRDLAQLINGINTHVGVANVNLIAAKITTSATDRAYFFRTAIERLELASSWSRQADRRVGEVKKEHPFHRFA